MNSLSSVVKSSSVVDDRAARQKTPAEIFGADLGGKPVIKRQMFSYIDNPYADEARTLPDKQGYIDELNRLKTEIAGKKAELRRMNRLVADAGELEDDGAEPPPGGAGNEAADDSLAEARAESDSLLSGARAQAAALLEKARKEAAELREQTVNIGYLEGFEKGTREAQEEFRRDNEPKIAELDAALDRLSDYAEEQLAKNERELLELVFAVAKKVLGQEIKAEPRVIVSMLYETLDKNRREDDIRVTVSPELMPAEGKATEEIRKLIAKAAPHATIVVDSELAEGSVVVETTKGLVDLSVETQLFNLREELLED